jgi:uncharacterized membrane protein
MEELYERVDPFRAWLAALVGLIGVLVVGSLAFPRQVYDGFLWRYFWGPVAADGQGATCAVREGGETALLSSSTECAQAAGYVAEPGYTTVSTVSYAVILVFMLVGVVLLLRRLEISYDPDFFFALFPFVLFGGALRTVEDVGVTLGPEAATTVPFPWSAVLISPFIYFTVFFLTLAALLGSIALDREGVVERFQLPLAVTGALLLSITLAYLVWVSQVSELISFNVGVPVVILGSATVLTAVVWWATERFAPVVNYGTGLMGALIIWGHNVDGIANVLSLDWGYVFGLPNYGPKHVVNGFIYNNTGAIQPAWLTDAIGTAWPFVLLKLAAAVFVVWVFDERIFEESPTYSMLLMITVLAVGLGPGTRDMLRAMLGI